MNPVPPPDPLSLREAFPLLTFLRTPFAMLDLAAGESAKAYASLDEIAQAIHARRDGRGLQITNRHLVWDVAETEQRPTIRVDFISRADGSVQTRLTVLAQGCDADRLMAALRNTHPRRKAA